MDWKERAAGEQEEEISPRSERMNAESELSAYAASLIVWIETFSGKQLGEYETKIWHDRLIKYPMWKLSKMGEYTGKFDNSVFSYLDSLQMAPDRRSHVRLPYKDDNEKECGTKLWGGLRQIIGNDEIENKKAAISDLHAKLKLEYPEYKNFLKC